MKLRALLFAGLIISGVISAQNVRTSVADGLGTNPLVWDCICIPLPNDSIIINHNITLNVDFGFTDGAVVINSGGKLIGDSPMRAFAFSGLANFVNNGLFDVARVAFLGGSAYSGGTFNADSFFTNINTAAGWVSNGDMNIDFSYWNTGKFVLGAAAELIVGDNFYNGDSLISGVNAVLINDGRIRVNQDFANSDTIRGAGQFCIYNNSINLGVITGTVDMCDVSGGTAVDLNLGTIGGSVTSCTQVCNIGISEEPVLNVTVYPNPTSEVFSILSDSEIKIVIYDYLGQVVYSSQQFSKEHLISINNLSSGTYVYLGYSEEGVTTGKIIKR